MIRNSFKRVMAELFPLNSTSRVNKRRFLPIGKECMSCGKGHELTTTLFRRRVVVVTQEGVGPGETNWRARASSPRRTWMRRASSPGRRHRLLLVGTGHGTVSLPIDGTVRFTPVNHQPRDESGNPVKIEAKTVWFRYRPISRLRCWSRYLSNWANRPAARRAMP